MNKISRSIRYKKNIGQDLAEKISELYFLLKPQYAEDLTHQSVRALQYIQMCDGHPRVDDVRQHLGIATASASELIKRLATKGMIERRRSQADERVVELALTEQGITTLAQQTQMDVARLSTCLKQLDDGEDAKLLDLVEALVERAHKLGQPPES